jgi:lysozyme
MPDLPWLTTKNQGRGAAWLTFAVVMAAAFEGYAPHPYVDRVGTGHPITWCYGETKADGPVPAMNATFTEAECKGDLANKLNTVYGPAIEKCIPGMPPHRKAAIVDAAYNLGSGAICKGPIARRLNADDVAGGCAALKGYNHASGRVVAGLTRRRQAEYVMCMRND